VPPAPPDTNTDPPTPASPREDGDNESPARRLKSDPADAVLCPANTLTSPAEAPTLSPLPNINDPLPADTDDPLATTTSPLAPADA